jgi:hypothetical protein
MTVNLDPDTYVFDFGQYRDHSFKEVIGFDPDYIFWCIDNGIIDLMEEDLEEYLATK